MLVELDVLAAAPEYNLFVVFVSNTHNSRYLLLTATRNGATENNERQRYAVKTTNITHMTRVCTMYRKLHSSEATQSM